uniref:Uncharacterized protein n=1 Tax=Avena sativa TaxID=4498 RepID=A0ACD5UFD7_AVESA
MACSTSPALHGPTADHCVMMCLGSSDSSSASAPPPPPPPQQRGSELELELPPGFRFHPTDEELLVHYLRKKAAKVPLPVTIIAEVDLYKFDPWELPEKATFGEREWYFFSPRDRKYPNGARPNRAATSGYWKATGTDKPILASGSRRETVGVRKALVFYRGKPPKGIKTNWIMHEYRLTDGSTYSSTTTTRRRLVAGGTRAASSLRLDDWVLCRIYEKSNKAASSQDTQTRSIECQDFAEDAVVPYPPYAATDGMAGGSDYGSQLHHHGSHEDSFLDGLLTADYAGGISLGTTSLSHLAAPASSSRAATKQLLPPSSPTLFNWLNESTVRILPPADMAGVADNPANTMMSAFILGTSLPPEASAAAASAFQHPRTNIWRQLESPEE